MKILHTSDLHISSPLSSRLSPKKAQLRKRELLSTFDSLIGEARAIGADVIIVAGDLFDDKKVTESVKQRILDSVRTAPDITFIYTPGNHEGNILEKEPLPENFIMLAGESWSYYTSGNVRFCARTRMHPGMFDTLEIDRERVNVAILHAELKNYDSEAISPKEATGCGLDYIALGHYHKYSEMQVDDKTVAVYCGAPHARGFDETDEKGYVIIDTDKAPVAHRFVPLGGRRVYDKEINVTSLTKTADIVRRIDEGISSVGECDLLRVTLVGERSPEIKPDLYALENIYSKRYWYFEIKDETRITVDVEAIKYDKTLKGEFIRKVLADGDLSNSDKSRIIDFGIRALMGEIPDGE